jgi:hypothetical protein
MKEEELKILQTTIFLLDDMKEYELLSYGLLPYLKKAKEIIKIIK